MASPEHTATATKTAATKTVAEQHVRGLQATELELGQTEAALAQANQQMRALNARRQRLIEGRATILRLLGLDPTKLYSWTAAKTAGRYLPAEVTPEQVAATVREMRAQAQAQQQAQAAQAQAGVPAPPAAVVEPVETKE